MKRIKTLAFLATMATFLMGAMPAAADYVTGRQVLENCSKVVQSLNRDSRATYQNHGKGMWCFGYVRGFAETAELIRNYEVSMGQKIKWTFVGKNKEIQGLYCPDKGVTYGQKIRVIVKYLQENEKTLDHPGAAMVWNALAKAYPCKK